MICHYPWFVSPEVGVHCVCVCVCVCVGVGVNKLDQLLKASVGCIMKRG